MRKVLRHYYLALLPLIPLAQTRVDAALGRFRAQEEILYLWSGEHVKRLFPGFEGLMADIYWLRTVQYFGGQRAFREGRNFDLLEPLVEITVALDPRMEIAYRYGSIFLCEQPPIGAGKAEAGVALLERATRIWPEKWRLRQHLGYFTFFFLKDSRRAADILLEAAEIEGAPTWLRGMAGNFLAQGGERQASRRIWMDIYQTVERGVMKDNALDNIHRLDALDAADILMLRARQYREKKGEFPRSLRDLQAAGMLPFPPVDPRGFGFEYDPATGTVSISKQSRLWRPEE